MNLRITGQSLSMVFTTALLLIYGAGATHAERATDKPSIEYETVEQVFDAMEADENAARTDYGGWIIYNIANQGSYTLWSITPEDHPANPTAIRRDILSKDGVVSIQMAALCQAEKVACDKLFAEFQDINAGIKQRMENGGNG